MFRPHARRRSTTRYLALPAPQRHPPIRQVLFIGSAAARADLNTGGEQQLWDYIDGLPFHTIAETNTYADAEVTSGFDVVVVCAVGDITALGTKYRNCGMPVLGTGNPVLFTSTHWDHLSGTDGNGVAGGDLYYGVEGTGGPSWPGQVVSTTVDVSVGTDADTTEATSGLDADAQVVTRSNTSGNATHWAFHSGATLADGVTTLTARAAIYGADYTYWDTKANDAGKALLRGMLDWLAPSSAPPAVSVALSPATVTWSSQALTVTPGAANVTLSPATVVWSSRPITPVPGAVSVTLASATASWSAQPLTVMPGAMSVTVTPAGVAFAAQALAITVGAVSITLTPASMAWAAQSLSVSAGAVSITASPAVLTWSAEPITPVTTYGVELTPAILSGWVAQPLTVTPGPISVALSLATVTWSARTLTITPGTVSVTLAPAGMAWSVQALTVVPGPISVVLVPVAVTWTAGTITPFGGPVSLALTSAIVTWAAQPLIITSSGGVELTPATTGWVALALTPTPGSFTLTLTPAGVSWAAQPMAVSGGPVSVALTTTIIIWSAPAITPSGGSTSISLTPAVIVWSTGSLTVNVEAIVVLIPCVIRWEAAWIQPGVREVREPDVYTSALPRHSRYVGQLRR